LREFLEQFERVKRSLVRIENQDRNSTEYDDDLWHFFQDCYHLKDWIKNDPNIPYDVKGETEYYVKNNKELRICADLANRSKHLKLILEPREDADITNRSVNIIVGPEPSTREVTITLRNGCKFTALEVAREAVKAWESFLSKNNLI